MSNPVKFIINQNTQARNMSSGIKSFPTYIEFEVSVQLLVCRFK